MARLKPYKKNTTLQAFDSKLDQTIDNIATAIYHDKQQ